MRITVGERELVVKNCYAYRYQNGKLVLKIEVNQSEIAHDELKTLIKDNTDDIICEKEDGTKEIFSGFRYTLSILDKDDTYTVEVECISEAERKIADLQHRVEEQAVVIQEQSETIEAQAGVIEELNDTLLELIMA